MAKIIPSLPREFHDFPFTVNHLGSVSILEQIYSVSRKTMKRRIVQEKLGMAAICFIHDLATNINNNHYK
jgi:hypothetical protein